MLAQRDEDVRFRPAECALSLFNKAQQNWHVSEQEILAVVHFCEKWGHPLMANEFITYTDHPNLQKLFNRAEHFKAGKSCRLAQQ